MRVQSETDLVAFQDWTLRVRSSPSPRRLLLLLHGWTGDENSMWVFVRNFSSHFWIIAPRGPHPARPFGYSWRPLPDERRDWPSLEDLQPSAHALIGLVDSYAAANGIDARQFDAIGFSQGAALTNTLALLYPERIYRAGVLAGFIPAHTEQLVAECPLNGKALFVAHGTLDETVRIEYARQSVEILQKAGAQVTFCEDEVGHKVSANCLRGLETFFAE